MTDQATPANVGSNDGLGAWQPIETAPKDGERFLIWYYDIVRIGWFDHGSLYLDNSEGRRVVLSSSAGKYGVRWMPLPTPPESA